MKREGINVPTLLFAKKIGGTAAATVVNLALHSGSSTLDATLVANKHYILADTATTFNIPLPEAGTYNDRIAIDFKATDAFTLTSSGGTVLGTLPTTVANKHYHLVFEWGGAGWVLITTAV